MNTKLMCLVSETMKLEEWWRDLSETEPMTNKLYIKMWAINDVINRMWKRYYDFKQN